MSLLKTNQSENGFDKVSIYGLGSSLCAQIISLLGIIYMSLLRIKFYPHAPVKYYQYLLVQIHPGLWL